ncbi:hypothetical protein HMI54_013142 [Coelomomyces lativittatus]|nr:hypothetical protein HMI56_006747 [Coelomomyces lativittatus]KAJ1514353.1 hypothetical protein HMI55_004740 [Coelomomyces lativittatus]KAJ1518646.1 hypothetical protein HMI54_013142 [Coelomomyces lativittatus]
MVHLLDPSTLEKTDTQGLCSHFLDLFTKVPNIDGEIMLQILDLLRFRIRENPEENRTLVLQNIEFEVFFKFFEIPDEIIVDNLVHLVSDIIKPFPPESILKYETALLSGLEHSFPSVPEFILIQLHKLEPVQWNQSLVRLTLKTLFNPSFQVFQALKPLFQNSSILPLFFCDCNTNLFKDILMHPIAKYRLLEISLSILPTYFVELEGLFLPIPDNPLDFEVYVQLVTDAAFSDPRVLSNLAIIIEPMLLHTDNNAETCFPFFCSVVIAYPHYWDTVLQLLPRTSVKVCFQALLRVPPGAKFPETLLSNLRKIPRDGALRLSFIQPHSNHILDVFGALTPLALLDEFCGYLSEPQFQVSVFRNFEILCEMPLFAKCLLDKVVFLLNFSLQTSDSQYSRFQFFERITHLYNDKLDKDTLVQINTFLNRGAHSHEAINQVHQGVSH